MALHTRIGFAVVLATLTLLTPTAAQARTIVLSNDDGLTSNVVALYRALKADGHDVIVSVPCQNQSGMGAALGLRPLGALEKDCRNGAAAIGAPGAGPITRAGLGDDFYYVNSTPVMAVMYGLDVVAMQRWGKAPDLVLSGPNEGQNIGSVIINSGTISIVQFANLRGLPAIAFSAGQNSAGAVGTEQDLANPESPIVADQAMTLIRALDNRSRGGPMLPLGMALNVNFPDQSAGKAFCAARVGTYNEYTPRFVGNLAVEAPPEAQERAKANGQDIPALPGVLFGRNPMPPTPDQARDESAQYRLCITVSPMQAGYAMVEADQDWFPAYFNTIWDGDHDETRATPPFP